MEAPRLGTAALNEEAGFQNPRHWRVGLRSGFFQWDGMEKKRTPKIQLGTMMARYEFESLNGDIILRT